MSRVTSRPAEVQHLRDLVRLRRVRDRIDREYAQPLDVEALARGAHMSAGHLSREFKAAYGESPYSYRDLLRGRLRVAGHLQHSLHRTGRHAAQHLPEPGRRRDGGDAGMRGQAGDQAGQESRSAGHRPAASLTGMDITIHASVLPHDDPDASLAFYRDILGFEVRTDVGQGTMRWITVGPAGQPSTSILLAPPAVGPGFTEDERRTIAEMMAKGTYGWILLATKDLDGTFERLQASDAEVVQEPVEQPYGIRDCAFRDPAGNLVRIQEVR
jgi:AraC-like DNA-binding protein/catechol 2,3-dioxygenase-like lactoylglutathione lyase family enzyme